MKSFRNSLQSTLTYSIIILVVIIVLSFFVMFKTTSDKNHSKLINNSLSVTNQRINDFHEIYVTSLEMFINDISKAIDENGNMNVNHIYQSINEYEVLREGTSIALGLEDGTMYSSKFDNLPVNYDPRTRPWYSEALTNNNQVYLTQPYLTADETQKGAYVLTYSKTINSQSGDLIGVVGVNVNLNSVFHFAKDNQLPQSSFIALSTKDGKVMISNSHDLSSINQFKINIASLRDNAVYEILFQGTQYLVYCEANDVTSWKSLVFIPKAQNDKLLFAAILASLLLFMILIFITKLYAKKMSYRISKPIQNVVDQIDKMDLSGHQECISIPDSDLVEVNTLTNGINTLLHRVFEQRSSLEETHNEINQQYMKIHSLYEESDSINKTLNETMTQLENSWLQTIRVLSNAIEANDLYTKGHCDRVAMISYDIGNELGLNSERLKALRIAALLHDVGKVGIPESILNKEGKLTEKEYAIVKEHPKTGYNIVKDVPYLEDEALIILHHHEQPDGIGYPSGLKSDELDIEPKIIRVVDAYDAMTSVRVYRKNPLSHEEAIKELLKFRGTQFESVVVDALIKVTSAD